MANVIIAKTQIVVGDTTFKEGEIVKNLSKIDKEWMAKAGYIEEKEEEKADPKKKEDEAGGKL